MSSAATIDFKWFYSATNLNPCVGIWILISLIVMYMFLCRSVLGAVKQTSREQRMVETVRHEVWGFFTVDLLTQLAIS